MKYHFNVSRWSASELASSELASEMFVKKLLFVVYIVLFSPYVFVSTPNKNFKRKMKFQRGLEKSRDFLFE